MGQLLSVKEVAKMLDSTLTKVYAELREGRLTARMIIANDIVLDSDDVEKFIADYMGDNWMNEQEIARYLGLQHHAVVLGLHDYEAAGVPIRQNSRKRNLYYNIDSPVVQRIFQVKGWDKYARIDGHKEGKRFTSEAERRRYAKSAFYSNKKKKRKRGNANHCEGVVRGVQY